VARGGQEGVFRRCDPSEWHCEGAVARCVPGTNRRARKARPVRRGLQQLRFQRTRGRHRAQVAIGGTGGRPRAIVSQTPVPAFAYTVYGCINSEVRAVVSGVGTSFGTRTIGWRFYPEWLAV
jgi:hypothetical protein